VVGVAGPHKISQIELFVSLSTTYLTGLSAEQEAWLESVSYGNISTDWPLLSTNQSGYLMLNVQSFKQLTETANYPYHQAGMPYLHFFPFCAQLPHHQWKREFSDTNFEIRKP